MQWKIMFIILHYFRTSILYFNYSAINNSNYFISNCCQTIIMGNHYTTTATASDSVNVDANGVLGKNSDIGVEVINQQLLPDYHHG